METTDTTTADVKAAHTPGPWRLADNHPSRACFDVMPVDINSEAPAPMYAGIASVSNYCSDRPEYVAAHEANARLIAAAPELLEALIEAEGIIEMCIGAGLVPMTAHAGSPAEKIRAAIAKATGVTA